jgi:RNA polymerase sigma-70 factor, ECF subfamily
MAERTPPGEGAVEELCAQVVAGQEGALQRLLGMHHARLVARAARKIGMDWGGRIDAEEIVQEAYIAIVADLPSFSYRGEDSFYHWAGRIVDHRFIDAVRHLRRKKRDAAKELTPGPASSRHESFLVRLAPDLVTPSQGPRRDEAVAALMCCIAGLAPDERAVVRRLFLLEERAGDVALDMGRSEDAVRRLGSRALDKLRMAMGTASRFLSA